LDGANERQAIETFPLVTFGREKVLRENNLTNRGGPSLT